MKPRDRGTRFRHFDDLSEKSLCLSCHEPYLASILTDLRALVTIEIVPSDFNTSIQSPTYNIILKEKSYKSLKRTIKSVIVENFSWHWIRAKLLLTAGRPGETGSLRAGFVGEGARRRGAWIKWVSRVAFPIATWSLAFPHVSCTGISTWAS